MSISSSTLLKDSMQAAFNKAVTETLKQGRRAVNQNHCVYRKIDDKGICLKCAIGQLLTDEQIEKYSIFNARLPNAFDYDLLEELVPGYVTDPTYVRNFLSDLQKAHDQSSHSYLTQRTKGRGNI